MKTSWHKAAVAIALAVLFGTSAVAAQQGSAVIQNIQGTVEMRQAGAAAWAKAAQGGKLSAGMTVRTGAGSSCTLKWGDGHVLKLQALSTLDVSRLETDTAGNEFSAFGISKGKINAHATKLKSVNSKFEVKTPTAIAGVRGTDLFVNVEDDNTSTIGVTDGELYVEMEGVETILSEDFMLTISPEGEAGTPEPIPEEIRNDVEQQLKEVEQSAVEGNAPADETEPPAAPEDVDTAIEEALENVDAIIEQREIADIVEEAQTEPYTTGDFEIEIVIEP